MTPKCKKEVKTKMKKWNLKWSLKCNQIQNPTLKMILIARVKSSKHLLKVNKVRKSQIRKVTTSIPNLKMMTPNNQNPQAQKRAKRNHKHGNHVTCKFK